MGDWNDHDDPDHPEADDGEAVARAARVRQTLGRALASDPARQAIGAINGIGCSLAAAYLSGERILFLLTIALALVALARVTLTWLIERRLLSEPTPRLAVLNELSIFAYSAGLGAVAAVAVALEVPASVETLAVASAIGYGIAICARNVGQPGIAMGQLALIFAPVMVASLWVGGLAMILLAATMLLLWLAMAGVTLNLAKVLGDFLASAQTSRELAGRMQTLARTDVVTGLANRAGLEHALDDALARQPDRLLAMFWIDLDHFKEVNDLLGHHIGDQVLNEIATRLQALLPADATLARFAGDEFVLFCDIASHSACEQLGAGILAEINRPMRLDRERLELRASIGIAMMNDRREDADTLKQHADLALYHAKASGRNRIAFFHRRMTSDLLRRREIEADLRAALQRDELSIYFQPIVDLATGRIRAFEALVRWFHPEKGELRPDEFIPVAEESGAIVTLGNWIAANAARAAANWPKDVTLAVNLSPVQIKAPGAALGILNALAEARLDPRRLELEVTERLFLEDSADVEGFVTELSAAGVRFALDDFGTGYSSLAYINRWPFSKIKVDRSFVSGPDVGRKSDAIIRAVSQMATTLGMDIVAEGLETVDQVGKVRDAGCNLGQGYYFSRAVPDYLAAMLLEDERKRDEADGPNESGTEARDDRG